MRRGVRAWVAVLLGLAVLAGAAPVGAAPAEPARAAVPPGLAPPGFHVQQDADGMTITWTSPTELRMGGARPEFRVGDVVVGYPREVGGTLRLDVDPARAGLVAGRLAALEVWSAGRRLDQAGDARRQEAPPATGAEPPSAIGPTPVVALDPARPGPFATVRSAYELPGLAIEPFPAPVEVVAEVTRPVGAPGPRPLALFLHGRHSTCFFGGPEGDASGDWPCPPGWQPLPSHQGYRYLTDVAASQGWIAVSIAANGVNGQDYLAEDGGAGARSALLRHHLGLWEAWDRAGGDPLGGWVRGAVDLDRVTITGHSRGGEGASRAAVDTPADAPYRIRGLVLVGPTAFGRQVRPDVHTAVLLPSCDGDVLDLQGQHYVDDSRDLADSPAVRTAVVALGANHNFFNTEWTPGLAAAPAFDDWFDSEDPTCGVGGSVRLDVEAQQRVGAAYTMALLRLAARDDQAMLPLLDGTWVKPEAIGAAEVGVNDVGGAGRLLFTPGRTVLGREGMTAATCAGYRLDPDGGVAWDSPCLPGRSFEVLPHWQPMYRHETRTPDAALELRWDRSGAQADLPAGAVNLRRYDALDVRVAAHPDLHPAGLGIRVRDTRGRSAALPVAPPAVAPWPGDGFLDRVQARTLRADLRAASGVDLRRVAAVELVGTSASGHVWVLDVTATRDLLADPPVLDLPRVSVGDIAVPEPDGGERVTVDVPVTVSGRIQRPAELWVQVSDHASAEGVRGFPLVLAPGTTSTSIPVTVEGDEVFRPHPREVDLVVSALAQVLTSDYEGEVQVLEDEPAPVLSVDAAAVAAPEGGALRWTFRLSGPAADSLFYGLPLLPGPAGTVELDTDDVTDEFLRDYFGLDTRPVPAIPLSDWNPFFSLFFEPGSQEVTFEIPLREDGVAEPEEQVTLQAESFVPDDPTLPEPLRLTGIVPAH